MKMERHYCSHCNSRLRFRETGKFYCPHCKKMFSVRFVGITGDWDNRMEKAESFDK